MQASAGSISSALGNCQGGCSARAHVDSGASVVVFFVVVGCRWTCCSAALADPGRAAGVRVALVCAAVCVVLLQCDVVGRRVGRSGHCFGGQARDSVVNLLVELDGSAGDLSMEVGEEDDRWVAALQRIRKVGEQKMNVLEYCTDRFRRLHPPTLAPTPSPASVRSSVRPSVRPSVRHTVLPCCRATAAVGNGTDPTGWTVANRGVVDEVDG